MAPSRTVNWYIARPDAETKVQGPVAESEIGKMLREGTLSWTDGVWNTHLGEAWRRIMDIPVFRQYLPEMPDPGLIRTIAVPKTEEVSQVSLKPARSRDHDPQTTEHIRIGESETTGTHSRIKNEPELWNLNYEGSKFGPLSTKEICGILERGKLHGSVLVQAEGKLDWTPLREIAAFKEYFATGRLPPGRLEKRKQHRKPLVATVQFSRIKENGERSKNVYTGICRDISVGGMDIGTSEIPSRVGMLVILEVTPTSESGIPAFDAEGEVMRTSGDSFGVRFRSIPKATREAIENFIADAEAKIELE